MSTERFNQEVDDEIRSKRIVTAAMLHQFDLAHSQDSASSANWLAGKLKIVKEVLESAGRIEISDGKSGVLSNVQAFDKWVRGRYPDVADDV